MLFYHAPNEADFEQLAALGGIEHHIVSHRHEAEPSPDPVKMAFGARLCSDAVEAPEISKESQVDLVFAADDGRLGSIDVLHTPGHTQGGISCTYRSPHGELYTRYKTGVPLLPSVGQVRPRPKVLVRPRSCRNS